MAKQVEKATVQSQKACALEGPSHPHCALPRRPLPLWATNLPARCTGSSGEGEQVFGPRIKLMRAAGRQPTSSLKAHSLGKGQGLDWECHPSAWVSVEALKVRTNRGDTSPTTQTETLTCTKWTDPLGLKQRKDPG